MKILPYFTDQKANISRWSVDWDRLGLLLLVERKIKVLPFMDIVFSSSFSSGTLRSSSNINFLVQDLRKGLDNCVMFSELVILVEVTG